jgi:hypothetical protein
MCFWFSSFVYMAWGKKRERDAPSTYWPMTTPPGNIDNKPRDLAAEVRVQWDALG